MRRVRQSRRAAACVLVAAILFPVTAHAQASATLTGIVQEDSTGRPIANAEVAIESLKRQTVADADGRYRLTNVPAGVRTVSVRRLGYTPLVLSVQFLAGEVIQRSFSLRPSATALDTLRVSDTNRPLTGRAAFYDRRARGFGRFMDSTELRKLPDLRASTMLVSEFGIMPVKPPLCRPYTPRKNNCVGSQSTRVAVGRGICALKVMLDGMVVGIGGEIDDSEGHPDPRHNWYTAFDISTVNSGSLEKVELYRRESEVPPEYQSYDTQCGLLLLWTRQY